MKAFLVPLLKEGLWGRLSPPAHVKPRRERDGGDQAWFSSAAHVTGEYEQFIC